MYRRLALVPAACAALALTACGDKQEDNPISTEIVTIKNETPAASSEAAAAKDDHGDEAHAPASATTDGALAAIQDALAAHPEGIVAGVDREGDSYEIDLVEGEDRVELTVDAKGKVTEAKREGGDADDIAEAKAATVTAMEAAQQALDAHEGGVIDSLSLDEEDGTLEWNIDLDDAEGNDLAEMKVPAA